MKRLYLLALSFALCATSNLRGDGPTFTTIDPPGATSPGWPWSINTRGDVVGFYTSADKVTHGYRLSGGQYTTLAFPGATSTILYGINPGGDIVGSYTFPDNIVHSFLLSGGQFAKID